MYLNSLGQAGCKMTVLSSVIVMKELLTVLHSSVMSLLSVLSGMELKIATAWRDLKAMDRIVTEVSPAEVN